MVLIILLILVPSLYYVFFFLFECFSQLLITGNKWTCCFAWKKRDREMTKCGSGKFAEAREGSGGQSQKFLPWWGLMLNWHVQTERNIFAHFLSMIENQRERNLFSMHSGFGKNKFNNYLSLWHKLTVVQKDSGKIWKYLSSCESHLQISW